MKRREVVVDLISLLYISLFLYAAFSKLVDYDRFRVQLGQSPLLTSIAGFVAWFIPFTEIMLATALSFTRSRLLGLYGSFTLMVIFTAYIIAILNFSEYLPCSCGGILEKLSWTQHLVFNLCLIALILLGILLTSSKHELS
ncbi:MauE/DoxX family redox-associated membrane protein [Dyadobacter jiangsuensis]